AGAGEGDPAAAAAAGAEDAGDAEAGEAAAGEPGAAAERGPAGQGDPRRAEGRRAGRRGRLAHAAAHGAAVGRRRTPPFAEGGGGGAGPAHQPVEVRLVDVPERVLVGAFHLPNVVDEGVRHLALDRVGHADDELADLLVALPLLGERVHLLEVADERLAD